MRQTYARPRCPVISFRHTGCSPDDDMEATERSRPEVVDLSRRGRVVLVIAGLAAVAICLGLALSLVKERETYEASAVRAPVSSTGPGFGLALYQALGERMRAGHEAELLPNGRIFDGLDAAIRGATSSIHIEVFIWQKGKASDRLLTALEQRHPGVTCRILADDLGSPKFDQDIRPRLEKAGCEARIFRPAQLQGDVLSRSHRKLAIVDGTMAFTGGFGIRDEWLGDGITNDAWRDSNVRFTGPAVCDAQQAFSMHWHDAGGGLLPPESFPGFDPVAAPPTTGPLGAFVASAATGGTSRAERLLRVLIASAKSRLWIANAYFVPPTDLLERMKAEAHEGVDVRILLPGAKSDSTISRGSQHVNYGDLIASGIKFYEYDPSMMHAKTIVVDGEVGMVSSINLDELSLDKLEEDALVIQDAAFNARLAESFEQDLKHATQVHE